MHGSVHFFTNGRDGLLANILLFVLSVFSFGQICYRSDDRHEGANISKREYRILFQMLRAQHV